MNPFRRSREFALYRQLVFGARAGAPERDDLDLARHDGVEPAAAHKLERNDEEAPGDAGMEIA